MPNYKASIAADVQCWRLGLPWTQNPLKHPAPYGVHDIDGGYCRNPQDGCLFLKCLRRQDCTMGRSWRIGFLSTAVLVAVLVVGTQTGSTMSRKTWNISGRVLSLQGEPLGGARVELAADGVAKDQRVMETNAKGEFQTQIAQTPSRGTRLQGVLVASKSGYLEGREMLDLRSDNSAGSIEIILCKPNDGEEQLPIAALANILGPQLKNGVAKGFPAEASQTEFIRGYEELMGRQDPAKAIPLFHRSIERTPACIECQLLMGLSLLHAGRWGSARKQMEKVSGICDSQGVKKAELSLINGVMEAWRGMRIYYRSKRRG